MSSEDDPVNIEIHARVSEKGRKRILMLVDCAYDEFLDAIADMATDDWQQNIRDTWNAGHAALDLGVEHTTRTFTTKRDIQ